MNEDSGHNLRDATLSQEDAKIMERYERKLIEDFLTFFLGENIVSLFGIDTEKLIEDFFKSRK